VHIDPFYQCHHCVYLNAFGLLEEAAQSVMDDREQQVINLLIQHRTLLVQIALKLLHTEVLESEEFNRLLGKDKKAA